MTESLSRWAAGVRRHLLDVSRSQWATRSTGAVALLLVLVVAPSGHPVAGLAAVMVLVGATLVMLVPEPVGGVAAVGSLGFWLVLAPVPLASPRTVAVAALALVHLASVVVAASAPPSARVSSALVRRYAVRCAALTGAAAVVWAFALGARSLPAAPLPVALAALLLVAGAALLLLADGRRDG